MKRKISFFLMVAFVFSISGCFDKETKAFIPNVTGKLGEVLLIMDKTKWQGESGRVLRTVLMKDYPSLPQSETMFKVMHINPAGFSNLYKDHRNILRINIGKRYKKAVIKISEDVWAKPQLIVDIEAPTDTAFRKLVDQRRNEIEKYILEAEFERIQKFLYQNANKEVTEKLRKNYSISLLIPHGYEIYATKPNFIWIHHETDRLHQGVWIYMRDYTDTALFQKETLIKIRNNVIKRNIPGPTDDSYMATERIVPVDISKFTKNNHYTVEMRGLWRTEGDYMMGGPFVSHTIVDEERNRFIMVEGFVYAGKQDKKLFLWQVEAIVRSLKIMDTEGTDVIEEAL